MTGQSTATVSETLRSSASTTCGPMDVMLHSVLAHQAAAEQLAEVHSLIMIEDRTLSSSSRSSVRLPPGASTSASQMLRQRPVRLLATPGCPQPSAGRSMRATLAANRPSRSICCPTGTWALPTTCLHEAERVQEKHAVKVACYTMF